MRAAKPKLLHLFILSLVVSGATLRGAAGEPPVDADVDDYDEYLDDDDEYTEQYLDEGQQGEWVDGTDQAQLDAEGEELQARLDDAEAALYWDPAQRNIARGVALMAELADELTQLPAWAPPRRQRVSGEPRRPVRGGTAPPGGRPPQMRPPLWNAGGQAPPTAAVDAAFIMGVLAATGVASPHVRRDEVAATRWYARAAAAGSLDAHLAMAMRYELGHAAPRDCPQAVEHLKLAAETFVVEAEASGNFQQHPLPVVLRQRWRDASYRSEADVLNGPEQLSMEMDLARRGDREAQHQVAYRQLVGLGMDEDIPGAMEAFQAGADANDPFALFNLGYLHLKGLHNESDYGSARQYFEKAARGGLAAAYNGLGVLHYHGQGVPANITAARMYWEKGYAGGDQDAMFNLASLSLSGADAPRNVSRAVELLQEATDAGHWKAPMLLGVTLAEGDGLPEGANCTRAIDLLWTFVRERANWSIDLEDAVKTLDSGPAPEGGDDWTALFEYLMLAEQGSDAAMVNAAWLLERRRGYSGADAPALALRLYRRSADFSRNTDSAVDAANLIRAEALLGDASAREAAALYATAAAGGNVEGASNLAWCAGHGAGVPRNVTRAFELYRQAISLAGGDSVLAFAPRALLLWTQLSSLLSAALGGGDDVFFVERGVARVGAAVARAASAARALLPSWAVRQLDGLHSVGGAALTAAAEFGKDAASRTVEVLPPPAGRGAAAAQAAAAAVSAFEQGAVLSLVIVLGALLVLRVLHVRRTLLGAGGGGGRAPPQGAVTSNACPLPRAAAPAAIGAEPRNVSGAGPAGALSGSASAPPDSALSSESEGASSRSADLPQTSTADEQPSGYYGVASDESSGVPSSRETDAAATDANDVASQSREDGAAPDGCCTCASCGDSTAGVGGACSSCAGTLADMSRASDVDDAAAQQRLRQYRAAIARANAMKGAGSR